MKREIKFRVWWPDSSGEGGQMIANPSGSFQFLNDFFKEMSEEETSWTFMQFTGLHDKNRVEIYEGDFLKSNEVVFEIRFGWNTDNNCFGWCCHSIRMDKTYSLDHSVNKMEVIGNIYENPDLIK